MMLRKDEIKHLESVQDVVLVANGENKLDREDQQRGGPNKTRWTLFKDVKDGAS